MLEYNTTCQVGGSNILCDLKYDQSIPAQVSFTFHIKGDSVEWIFSRELVRDAIQNRKAGQGDILFYDHGDAMSMLLRSDEGTGLAIFEREVLKEFVDDMYSLVPEDEIAFSDEDLNKWLDGLV